MLDPRMALIEKKYAKDTDTIPEFRSGDTVKVHVKHMLKKMKLKSRVEAAVWVHQERIF